MFELVSRIFRQFSDQITQIPLGKRIALLALAGVLFAAILLVSFYAAKPDFQVLYANLSPEDASEVVAKLGELQVPHKLVQQGTAVVVPSAQVYDLRIKLATEGLPQGGGVGFEIFDKSTFGMTEFVQKLNYIRAVQGELMRTINSISQVSSSRVHLVVPEDRLFTENKKEPSASVVLKLRPGKVLSTSQVQGIVNLVASAVEGLRPENVTVVDTKGNTLSQKQPSDDVSRMTTFQMDYRENLEKRLEGRVQTMLENVLGPNKAIARVTADIDFVHSERTEETYDPASQVARSEQRSEQSDVGAELPVGVPGIQSNLPEEGESQLVAKPSKSSRTEETINYEMNKVVKHVVEPSGTIKKLSIAVMIDGTYKAVANEAGEETLQYVPRTEDDIKKYVEIVRTAAGVNEDRGDKIVVESVPFLTEQVMQEQKALEKEADRQFYEELVKYGMTGLLGIILLTFILRPLLTWLRSTSKELEELRGFPQTVSQLESELGMKAKAEEEKIDYRKEIQTIIQADPEGTADLLRKWIKDRGT